MNNIKQQFDVYSNALSVETKRMRFLPQTLPTLPHQILARDVDFEVELARSLNNGPLKTSSDAHIALTTKYLPGKVQYRQSINPSVDGNTVELAVEQMEFAENSIRYQTTLDFINSKIKGLLGAIRVNNGY